MLGSLHFSGTQMDPYYVNLFRRPRKENDWQPFGVGGFAGLSFVFMNEN